MEKAGLGYPSVIAMPYMLAQRTNACQVCTHHAYISSHSPSSSSSLGGGGGAFSFTKSFLSIGHVACNFNHGAMHSRSNM